MSKANPKDKATRVRIHRALVAAKPHLYDGRQWGHNQCGFICFAITEAVGMGKCSTLDSGPTKEMISARLGGAGSVAAWLIRHGHATKEELNWGDSQLQAYRHRWLDSLIAEFAA